MAATPAGRPGAAVAAWSQRHDDADEITRRRYEARSVSRRTEADGMVAVTARLTPEEAGPVGAVIDRRVASTRAPAGASLAQQRAGALVVAVTTGGTIAAEAVVHVRPGANTCGARSFLPYDHIRPYRDGRPTTIADLRRLCGEHNRARESGRLWS